MNKINTLFIIGNGFDRWQGIDSAYSSFAAYYLANRDKILKKLHIRPYIYLDEEGTEKKFGAVELVYGDPFDPCELGDRFWSSFENSLDKVDTYALNLFFGKGKGQLRRFGKCVRDAKRIMREAFCGWISSLQIPAEEAPYTFGENCFFINFNYTHSLSRFGVPQNRIFHIHGEAKDKKSIIYGHASHPYTPEQTLYRLGGRFRGLFLAEDLLYQTDKKVDENILSLIYCLALKGIAAEDIKDVYVLGHSMAPPDIAYFDFLLYYTRIHSGEVSPESSAPPEFHDDLDKLNLRMEYAIQRTGYGLEEVTEEQQAAVDERAEAERQALFADYNKMFMKMFGRRERKTVGCKPPKPTPQRGSDATWHVSCYSERDKTWARELFAQLEFENYELCGSIDDCILRWRNEH